MELLEANLARSGVESLSFASDPREFQAKLHERVNQFQKGLFLVGLFSTGLALFPASISTYWVVAGYGVAILSGLLSEANRSQAASFTPYITLWEVWKDEKALQQEIERLRTKIQGLKGETLPTRRIVNSMEPQDRSWNPLCDDLAGAASRVGAISLQGDRAHAFRSALLYAIRKATEALEQVHSGDRDGWRPLLGRKLEIAYLFTWIDEKNPPLKEGYPNRISDTSTKEKHLVQCYKTPLKSLP